MAALPVGSLLTRERAMARIAALWDEFAVAGSALGFRSRSPSEPGRVIDGLLTFGAAHGLTKLATRLMQYHGSSANRAGPWSKPRTGWRRSTQHILLLGASGTSCHHARAAV